MSYFALHKLELLHDKQVIVPSKLKDFSYLIRWYHGLEQSELPSPSKAQILA